MSKTTSHLTFHRRFAGLDNTPDRHADESPLSRVAADLVAEHESRESERLAKFEARQSSRHNSAEQVVINAVSRYEHRNAALQWNDDQVPAITKLDAYSAVKDASYAAPEDRGLKTAAYALYSTWLDDVSGTLDLSEIRQLKARIVKEQPKSVLPRVIDAALAKSGFSTLRGLPKLSRIAAEITDQDSYEAAMHDYGLDTDENIHARAYIRGLLKMGDETEVGRTETNTVYDRVAQRLAQMSPDMPMGDAGAPQSPQSSNLINDSSAAEPGMPPHDEQGEASAEVVSPISGEPLVLELGMADVSENGDAAPIDGGAVDPSAMQPAVPSGGPSAMPGGSMNHAEASRGQTRRVKSQYDRFEVIGQLSEMMGPGLGDKPDMSGPEMKVEGDPADEDLENPDETVTMMRDPSADEMIEITLRRIEEEHAHGVPGESQDELEDEMGDGSGLEMTSNMEVCAEHGGPWHECADLHKEAKSPPGKSKQVEEIKEHAKDEGYSKEKSENIAFGTAWNQHKKDKKKSSSHSLNATVAATATRVTAAEIDEHAKTELELYLYNTGELHSQHQAIIHNIMRKIRANKYDDSLAPKLWQYWVDQGARAYVKEFGGTHDRPKDMFPAAMRRALAAEIASQEYELIMNGEYGDVGAPKDEPGKKDSESTGSTGSDDMADGLSPIASVASRHFEVYATVNGEEGTEPLDVFAATSMTAALERIAAFGVDGDVLADPRRPGDEAIVIIDGDRGDWLHVVAFEAPSVNQQQPDQVSVPEDGATALESNGGFKQDRATRKVTKKTKAERAAMSRNDIVKVASSMGLTEASIESKLLDGEPVYKSGWTLRINDGDEVELYRDAANRRIASVLKLDDMIRDFQAAVVMDADENETSDNTRVVLAELFRARCAACKSVNEYIMPEESMPLTCAGCNHIASAESVVAAFERAAAKSAKSGATAAKSKDYLITIEVPQGRDIRDFTVNAKRVLSAIRVINATAEMETDATIRTAELTVRAVDDAALSRIEKVLSDVFGATPSIARAPKDRSDKSAQYIGQTPAMQAQPGLEDPSMQQPMQTMNTQPGAQQNQMQQALKPLQPGKMGPSNPAAVPSLGSPAMSMTGGTGDSDETDVVREANRIAQMMDEGDADMGGGMPEMGGAPSNVPGLPGSMSGEMPGSMPGQDMGMPGQDGGMPQGGPMQPGMMGGDLMDAEGQEAAHASLLHYRNQGMGVLDALSEFHRQYSDYLDSFGDEVSPERHMAEAEIVRIAGEVYSKPALIQRAAAMMETAMQMMASVIGSVDDSDDDSSFDLTNQRRAFEAPHANTQQPDTVSKSKLRLESDTTSHEPNFGPHGKPSSQGGTGHRQPGATPTPNPKPVGADSQGEPNFGDHAFGNDAQAGSQHHQPGVSHPDPHLGPDTSTGENGMTRKMDQLSKNAPNTVRSK